MCHFLLPFSQYSRPNHCGTSTASTHIESNCACCSGQSLFVSFWVTGFGQSKAIPVNYPEQVILVTVRPVVTVMAKWLPIQPMAIYHVYLCITHLLSSRKVKALIRVFYTVRYKGDAKLWLYVRYRRIPLPYHIMKVP